MERNRHQGLIRRYMLLLFGLMVNGLGVAWITKASLGTSPISSIPYVLSLGFSPTIGMFTFVFNALLVAAQIALLRRRFSPVELLQLPVTLVFSAFIDGFMLLLSPLNPDAYWQQLLCLLVGCCVLGFGVSIEMIANVVMLPGEAFVRTISDCTAVEFGKMKVIFDVSCTVIAAGIGFLLFYELAGVREGTLIAALFVGTFARFCKKHLNGLEKKLLCE